MTTTVNSSAEPLLIVILGVGLVAPVQLIASRLARTECERWLGPDPRLSRSRALLWSALSVVLAAAMTSQIATVPPLWAVTQQDSLALGLLSAIWVGSLVCAARIDLLVRLVPDRITLSLGVIGLFASLLGFSVPVFEAIGGGLLGFGLPWAIDRLLSIRRPSPSPTIGRGDLWLLAAMGVWLGVEGLPWVLALAGLLMVPVVLWGALARDWSRQTRLPFAPALAIAGLLVWPLVLSGAP